MDQISIEIVIHDMEKLKTIIKAWEEIKNECQLQIDTHFKVTVS